MQSVACAVFNRVPETFLTKIILRSVAVVYTVHLAGYRLSAAGTVDFFVEFVALATVKRAFNAIFAPILTLEVPYIAIGCVA